jgi:hypothetical protein
VLAAASALALDRTEADVPRPFPQGREVVAQTIGSSGFLWGRHKVDIFDRIISVADAMRWPLGPLSRGGQKRQLWNSYNGLGLCDILATEQKWPQPG